MNAAPVRVAASGDSRQIGLPRLPDVRVTPHEECGDMLCFSSSFFSFHHRLKENTIGCYGIPPIFPPDDAAAIFT